MSTNTLPETTVNALNEGIKFAQHVYAGANTGPAFALLHTKDGISIAMFGAQPGQKALTLKEIRRAAPKLARQHKAHAVTFGATSRIAIPADQHEADALTHGLKSGTLPSLADAPDTTPALLLEHHTRARITTAAFPITGGQIASEAMMAEDAPTAEAKPIEGIRFFTR